MADELYITGKFDASGIVEGIQKAASAIQEGASQITSSFGQMEVAEAAFESAGKGAADLIATLTGIREEAEETAATLASIAEEGIPLQGNITPSVEVASPAPTTPATPTTPVSPTVIPAPVETTESSEVSSTSEEASTAISSEETSVTSLNEAFAALTPAEIAYSEIVKENKTSTESENQQNLEESKSLAELHNALKEGVESYSKTSEGAKSTSTALTTIEPASQSASQATSSLESSLNAAGVGASNAIEKLTGITGVIGSTTPAVSEMDQTLKEMAVAQEEGVGSASSLSTAEQNIEPSVQSTVSAISTQDSALSEMASAQISAAEEAQKLAAAQAQWNAQIEGSGLAAMQQVQQGTTQLASTQSSAAESAIVYTQSQQELADSMASSGLDVIQEAQVATTELAAAQTEGAAVASSSAQAQQEAAAGAAQLGVQNTGAAKAVTTLASAISELNNATAVSQMSQQEHAAKLDQARNAAARLGLELVQTSGGFKLLKISTDEATQSMDRLTGAEAYSTPRMLANTVGAGNLGFALGVVGRASETLAPILAAAFPVVGVIALVGVIDTLIEKFEKTEEAITKTILQFDDLASSSFESAEALDLQNMKLEDQISKLEGRPVSNRLKEALIESSQAADKLNKSLETSIQKVLELTESNDVGLFKSLYTGLEPNTSIFGQNDDFKKLKEKESLLSLAAQQKRQADLELEQEDNESNRKAAEAADTRLSTAKTALQNEISTQQKRINDLKALQETPGPIPGVKGDVPGKPKEEVDTAFAQQQATITSAKIILDEYTLSEQRENQAAKDRIDLANQQNAADARARDKLLSESKVKTEEDSARQVLESAKTAASEKLKTQESEIQLEIQKEIASGVDKVTAEKEAEAKLLASKKAYYAALLAAQQQYLAAEQAALKEEAAILGRDLVTDKRIVALQANADKERDIVQQVTNEIDRLKSESNNVELQNESKTIAEETAERILGFKRTIDAKREEANQLISLSSQEASQETAAIRASAEEQLRVVDAQHSLKVVTDQQALQEKISILQQEDAAIKESTDKHIEELQRERDEVETLWQSLAVAGASSEVLKPLRDEYDKLGVAINKAATAQENFNTKIAQAQFDAVTAKWKESEQNVSDFFNTVNSGLSTFAQSALLTTKPLAEDFNQLFLEIDRSFINMIVKMIEDSELFKAIEGKFRNVLTQIFHIPVAPTIPQPTVTNIPLAGAPASVQQTLGQPAQEVGLATEAQAQQTAATATGEAQRTAITTSAAAQREAQQTAEVTTHATAESTKTATTTTGEASRTGVRTTATTVEISQQSTKVAAHTTAEASKTTGTVAGESARTGVKNVNLVADIARDTAKVAAHIAGELAMTAATVAGATARATVGIAEDLESILRAAAVAAAHAIKWVMEEVPFPANIAIAAATGAAVFGMVEGFASFSEGGKVTGPGTSSSDSIPARLSSGEYVLRAAAVENIGTPTLDALNQGQELTLSPTIFSRFGIAEKGALLDSDMPIFAHTNEMILPSNISAGLQAIITGKSVSSYSSSSTSTGPSHSISVHMPTSFSAIDGPSVARFFTEHEDKLSASLTRAVRRGMIKIRD